MLRDIPKKANKVLHLISICFLLIALRVSYLTLIAHEDHLEKAKLPRRKKEYTIGQRGTIRDRFNYPLAINRITYNAAILYDPIREIPRSIIVKEGGKKQKIYKRKAYIDKLSSHIAETLSLEKTLVHDTIFAKAALFPTTPQILKKGISEKEFYKIKMLEKDWPGFTAIISSERFYPRGKVAGDLIGYVGSIDRQKLRTTSSARAELENYLTAVKNGEPVLLPEGFSSLSEVIDELSSLKEKAYSTTSSVGKKGVEAFLDKKMRGSLGFRQYEVDTSGKKKRDLPISKKAKPGSRVVLNLSMELQEYAESLLAMYEHVRQSEFVTYGKDHVNLTTPWIQGGAIVAMIPKTGEVVAMASYPRFNSPAFTPWASDTLQMHETLETNTHVKNLWEGALPLRREFFDKKKGFSTEEKRLDWETYLSFLLSPNSSVKKALLLPMHLEEGLTLIESLQVLLDLSEQPHVYALIDALYPEENAHIPTGRTPASLLAEISDSLAMHKHFLQHLREPLDNALSEVQNNRDKLLFFDLLRLVCEIPLTKQDLPNEILTLPLQTLFTARQELACLRSLLKKELRLLFHTHVFQKWRDVHFSKYLSQKRKEEEAKKTYEKPYIEYLDYAEKLLFDAFWAEQCADAVLSLATETSSFVFQDSLQEKKETYRTLAPTLFSILTKAPVKNVLRIFPAYADLTAPLYGKYPSSKVRSASPTLQQLASAFYPQGGFGHARSKSYEFAAPQGSLFKVVTAYEGILEKYEKGAPFDLNPLTLVDEANGEYQDGKGFLLGVNEKGESIFRRYKGGTLPRSHGRIGKVDLIRAMQKSSNIYFSLLAGDHFSHPEILKKRALDFGFGKRTGIELPREFPGALPNDLRYNKTGLYAFAIGQHEFSCTPLQSAQCLSIIANKGLLAAPTLVKATIGEKRESHSPLFEYSYLYQPHLEKVGISFPYFTESIKESSHVELDAQKKPIHQKLSFPEPVHSLLLESMRSVVGEKSGSAHPFRIRGLYRNPWLLKNYVAMKPFFVGKTSTAEFMYKPHLNADQPAVLCQDIWFGGISYTHPLQNRPYLKPDSWDDPELVVVVYLRFGDYGKEAAPLAAEVMRKWREIKEKEKRLSCIEQ